MIQAEDPNTIFLTCLNDAEAGDLDTLQQQLASLEDDAGMEAVWFLVTTDLLRRSREGRDAGPDPLLRVLAWSYDMCAEHGRDLEGCADDELPHRWPLRLLMAADQ